MLVPRPSPDLLQPLPSALYNGHVLVGPFDAFDLDLGTQLNWHPSPSSGGVSLAVAGSSIVIAGGLTFVHGTPAVHVAALDKDLAPVVGFQSGLSDPDPAQNSFRGLALVGNRIAVIGRLVGPGGPSHMFALSKANGTVSWTAPSTPSTFPSAITVDPSTNNAYVGYGSNTASLQRYHLFGTGFTLDGTFAPTFDADDGRPEVTALTWTGGHLYVGGIFSAVNGTARQGLARFDAAGTLDPWAPKPITELHAPVGATIEVQPDSFLEVGDKVVVTGAFHYLIPIPGGGGGYAYGPPGVRVYSAATGALVRPTDGLSWYGYVGSNAAFGVTEVDDVVYVGLAYDGMAAFDANTFDYLPYLSVRTTGPASNAIYAVAARPAGGASLLSATAASNGDPSLVLGGVVPTWKHHTASNVLELGQGALNSDDTAPVASSITNRPRTGSMAGALVPWAVSWTGKDTGGSGITRYEIGQSRSGGPWSMMNVSLRSAAFNVMLNPGSTYRFRIRPVDRAGNMGAWAYGSTFHVTGVAQSSARRALPRQVGRPPSRRSGGVERRGARRRPGRPSAIRSPGGRSRGWDSAAPNRGKVQLFVNGKLKKTVDLRSSATQARTDRLVGVVLDVSETNGDDQGPRNGAPAPRGH